MYVIDSTAIFLRKAVYDKMVTIPEIVDEIKDEKSRFYMSLINLKVENSKKEFEILVRETAKRTGDIYKLSDADIKLIAKALELKATLVTDDYSIQNVAKSLGLKCEGIIQKGITKSFKWLKICRGCGKKVDNNIKACPICGSEVVLRRVKR